ncbi:glutaredoxin 2 [Deinococcus proteolyticus MRP]|uniref:Glutaredoxin 2 n=1 Tax=Deinococcus proteolyticus (strain ATCC 35074 / DSM 20540 / JCM 6276 / NBRC 101906 / NCIMB 13154 / VKM Ac-1939 / CCM 2703 / MRP) TaxID=693977 RepID=F0RJM3_DEIPM|nr:MULTISPECIES: glutaredoxin family protein [Deinococcus]ADY26593.1 glutaredoxin 2 [Deinococcus proteolyticus MRP]MCY1702717.1 glutaredoxin family protein [Deinococcus sp. SL84]
MTDSAAAPLPSTPLIPVFYTRASCKLCQQAEALLRAWEVPFQRVDIAGDEDLIARYGHHVPVLTLPLPGGERTLHRGPLTRSSLPALQLRLIRLRRELSSAPRQLH